MFDCFAFSFASCLPGGGAALRQRPSRRARSAQGLGELEGAPSRAGRWVCFFKAVGGVVVWSHGNITLFALIGFFRCLCLIL